MMMLFRYDWSSRVLYSVLVETLKLGRIREVMSEPETDKSLWA